MRNEKLNPGLAAALTTHVFELCAEHSIGIQFVSGVYPQSFPTIRQISTLPIEHLEDYACALHEIGHCVLCHRPEQPREWKEILAWKWAHANAVFYVDGFHEHSEWCLKQWGIDIPDPARYIQAQSIL